MPSILEERVWAGSEACLQAAIKAEEVQHARLLAGLQSADDDEEGPPRLLEVKDGIGYITIHGPLRNSADVWSNEMSGITGYPEIRNAMVTAANDPEVKHILLDINSGGGSVSGVDDTAKLIRLVNDKVKPVTAFTDGAMFSAAYYLGSSASEVYASNNAGVGSIGVIATHMEQSQFLKDMGIGVTVIRAGKYKALANNVEALSEDGKAQLQKSVDAAYGIFIDHVAEMRGESYEFADQTMGQGQEFYGKAAADNHLVDEILTFDALIGRISAKLIDQSNFFMDNRSKQKAGAGLRVEVTGDANMARKTLSETDIAALAAGVHLEANSSLAATATDDTAVTTETTTEAEAGVEDATAVEAVVDSVKDAVRTDPTLKFVTEQLNAANADLLNTKLALSKLEDKHAEMLATVGPLKDIAAKAVNNMRIAMGGSAVSMEGVSASQVLADYSAVSDSFTKKYPVGGVAAVTSADATSQKKSASPQHMARVAATRQPK